MLIRNQKFVTYVAVSFGTVACAFIVYKCIKKAFKIEEALEEKKPLQNKRETLIELLQAFEEDQIEKNDLINVLRRLSDTSAFNSVQDQIRNLGYLPKIVNMLNYPDIDVQCQTALLVNNLSLNVKNQEILKECIPLLIHLLQKNIMNDSTVTLFTASLCALTNLTTLDDSHSNILPHIPVFCELLLQCEIIQIKLQVLKIFVNISTNKKNCKNDFELAATILRSIEPFINPAEEERFLLRAISCCANVLEALHDRWEYGHEPHVPTPEFVSQRLNESLIRLSSHFNEDIRRHASRALKALRTPTSPRSPDTRNNNSDSEKLDKMDLLDVLKI